MPMLGGSGASRLAYWKSQLPVDYLDTSLTINTWENVTADLSAGKPARLWYIQIVQTNNGATAETVVIEITVNGVALTRTLTGIANTVKHYVYVTESQTTGKFTLWSGTVANTVGNGIDPDAGRYLTAESIGLIRVKQTTAVDVTTAQIEVNIVWDKLASSA